MSGPTAAYWNEFRLNQLVLIDVEAAIKKVLKWQADPRKEPVSFIVASWCHLKDCCILFDGLIWLARGFGHLAYVEFQRLESFKPETYMQDMRSKQIGRCICLLRIVHLVFDGVNFFHRFCHPTKNGS